MRSAICCAGTALFCFLLVTKSFAWAPNAPARSTSGFDIHLVAKAKSGSGLKACKKAKAPGEIIEACSAALEENPWVPWLISKRGNARLDMGDFVGGLEDAERVVELDPTFVDGFLLRARYHLDTLRPEQAESDIAAALTIDPDNALGLAYRARHNLDTDGVGAEALQDIDRAIQLASDNTDFYALRVRYLIVFEGPGEALPEIDALIKRKPNNAAYHVMRARLHSDGGEVEKAKADLAQAFSLDANLAEAFELRAIMHQKAGEIAEAEADANAAMARKAYLRDAPRLLASIKMQRPAAPVNTSCSDMERLADQMKGLMVTVAREQGQVGDPLYLDWSIPEAAIRTDQPTYLIAALPEAARLTGSGFFGLAPGAPGPYGMKYGAAKLRTITPLHTADAPRSGRIGILPYRAGPFPVEWRIVQMSTCGENAMAGVTGGYTFDVMPGAPQIVARDEFSTGRPLRAVTSARRPFRATVLADFIDVIDTVSGEVVMRTAGTDPVFSPTGRFMVVQTQEDGVSEVIDLVARRKLGRYHGMYYYWSHGDSFLYFETDDMGQTYLVRTLHGLRYAEGDFVPTTVSLEWDLPSGLLATDDIQTGNAGWQFATSSEIWSIHLSVEGGVVEFDFSSEYVDTSDSDEIADAGDATKSGEIGTAPDLAQKVSSQPEQQSSTEAGSVVGGLFSLSAPGAPSDHSLQDFGARDSEIRSGWAVGDLLYQGSDEGSSELGALATATETIVDLEGGSPKAKAESDSMVRSAMPMAGAISHAETAHVMRSALPHLPSRKLMPVDKTDDEAVSEIASDLSAFYPEGSVEFTDSPGAAPFPDPSGTIDGTFSVDLKDGHRQLWADKARDRRFWLTSSVEAGRVAYISEYTLLAAARGGLVRYVDLIEAATAFDKARSAEPAAVDYSTLNMRDVRTAEIVDASEQGADPAARPEYVLYTKLPIAGLSGGRYLTLVTQPVAHTVVFDLEEWKVVCTVQNPRNSSDIDRIEVHSDLRHITQVNKTGLVTIYSCADGTPVLSGIVADGEFVVTDGFGRFDGSEDAAAYVELKVPGLPGRHLLAQFAGALRTPGLADAVLGGRPLGAPPAPVAPPSLTASLVDRDGTAAVDISAHSLTGLRMIQILANGRVAKQLPVGGEDALVSLSADEVAGGIATVIATDVDGLTSAPLELQLGKTDNPQKGRLLGLAVGIDNYPGLPGSDLRYAVADARRIERVVRKAAKYEEVSFETLIDTAATPASITSELDGLIGSAKPEDTILLSFAGHGLVGEDGKLRLALSTTSAAAIEETSVDFDEIAARIAEAKARVVVLLDVCHAGASGKLEAASNDEAARLLTTRFGAGVVILSASKGRQYSEESSSIGGGRFSVAFERLLTTDRARVDSDGNGNLSLRELYSALKSTVVAETGGRQTPWLARNQIFGDFDVF
jgi:tetratricopeptide (TPR) repeat protein